MQQELLKPNSQILLSGNVSRVQFVRNGRKITALMPRDGCWNFSEENNEALIVEFDCKGQALGDIPGVCSKDGKIGHVSLLALYKGNKERPRYKF